MPLNKSAFYRYLLINRKLVNRFKPFPGKQEIIDYIHEQTGQIISERQLEYDFSEMRNSETLGFYAPIIYNRARRGYAYSDPAYNIGEFVKFQQSELESFELIKALLDVYKDLDVFKPMHEAIIKLLGIMDAGSLMNGAVNSAPVMMLQTVYETKGLQWLGRLLSAIHAKESLMIVYRKFDGTETRHVISPQLLKEHENRWYLVAVKAKHQGFLTFGLERIIELGKSEEPYIFTKGAAELFSDVIGITLPPDKKAVEVRLWFSSLAAAYVQSQFIHHSQAIKKKNNNGIELTIKVIPNAELRRLIFSWGKHCRVLKPKVLVQEINDELKQLTELYKE
jgi:predicted DNA-binding transcriptional regulator YafY